MAGAIWAVTQTEKGEPKGISYETIAAGQKLAEALDKPLEAVVVGTGHGRRVSTALDVGCLQPVPGARRAGPLDADQGQDLVAAESCATLERHDQEFLVTSLNADVKRPQTAQGDRDPL